MDQRAEFVLQARSGEKPFRELCRDFEISPKTGYKWMQRFAEQGIAGLGELSRRPHSSPAGLDEEVVCRIIRLKRAHLSWGPRKVRELYERQFSDSAIPSESSFKRVLEKAGLTEKRPPRRRSGEGGRLQSRRQATAPNQVWTVDFKGWWHTSDGMRCEPLTICDAHSRFLLCVEPLEDARTKTVRAQFEKVFMHYGLPETIRSDNGTPFASPRAALGLSRLSAWWLSHGISLDRIDPGKPYQNGSHERMHRDIAMELEGTIRGTLKEQRAALAVWRETYNNERPHEALGMRTPAEVYHPSQRRYQHTAGQLVYPNGTLVRRVNARGDIAIHGTYIFVTSALTSYDVGLRPKGKGLYDLWFGALCLGEVDTEAQVFRPAQPTKGGTP